MAMLKCDVCGHSLVMQADQTAVCEGCGLAYSLDALRQKAQSVDTAIPQVSSEKKTLLKNAHTFLELGKNDEAKKAFAEVAKRFPDDYRGWWGCFTSCRTYYVEDFISESVRVALQLNPALIDEHKAILQRAVDEGLIETVYLNSRFIDTALINSNLSEYFNSVVNTLMAHVLSTGNIELDTVLSDISVYPAQSTLRLAYEEGLPNMKKMNEFLSMRRGWGSNFESTVWRELGFPGVCAGRYDCFCVLGSTIGLVERGPDAIIQTAHLTVSFSEMLRKLHEVWDILDTRHAKKQCLECGTKLKGGLLSKPHCENCGKVYDY